MLKIKKELSRRENNLNVILSKFSIDLKKFIESNKNLNTILYEIVDVLNLFKKCLYLLNHGEYNLRDTKRSVKNIIPEIEKKISFYMFYKNDTVLEMLNEVEEKLKDLKKNLDSNNSVNN